MSLKVRSFERIIEPPGASTAIRVCGCIVDGFFVFSVGAVSWRLPTVECHSDDRGAYALLKEGEFQLGDRFVLRVQKMGSDAETIELDLGCEISLIKPGDTTSYEQILKVEGYKPEQFNILVPPGALLSVSFNSDGRVNGDTCMGPAVADLTTRPPVIN
jgi:hypothetical protein